MLDIQSIKLHAGTLENLAMMSDLTGKKIVVDRDMVTVLRQGAEDIQELAAEVERLEKQLAESRRREQAPEITGETSDGYHTFNELYHHRAVLFSVICNSRPELAWKSKKHNDGTMYDNMFIVGINTPQGQATYHYDIVPYWDMFKVRELPQAPEWDGHTPAQAIERVALLGPQDEKGAENEKIF